MNAQTRVLELLAEWEHARENGEDKSPTEICKDDPTLTDAVRDGIQILKGFSGQERKLGTDQSAGTNPPNTVRYVFISLLGQGGMGEVWKAEDRVFGRTVAIKIVKLNIIGGKRALLRFQKEAKLSGKLQHPGIVPVHDVGELSDGRPFYVMRIVEGDSLQKAIDEYHHGASQTQSKKNLASRKLLRHFSDACNAIAYAHSCGVLHRDIKPNNIMLGRYGETLVVDWGIAKSLRGDEVATIRDDGEGIAPDSPEDPHARTIAGTAIGTQGFMSPEQALGQIEKLEPASDVFSLGATLYQLLTGETAFKGTYEEIVRKTCDGVFVPVHKCTPTISKQLSAIVDKALNPSIQSRYRTVEELAQDVEKYLADERVGVYSESLLEKIGRWCRKHRTLTASSVVGIVLLSLGSIVGLQLHFTAQQEATLNRLRTLQSVEGNEQLALLELRANRFSNSTSLIEQAIERLKSITGEEHTLNRLNARLKQSRRLNKFYKLVDSGERYLIENSDEGVIEKFSEALAELNAVDNLNWWNELPTNDLLPSQHDKLAEDIQRRQIVLAGVYARIKILYPKEKERAAIGYQRSIQLLKVANSFRPTLAAAGVEFLSHLANGKVSDTQPLRTLRPKYAVDHFMIGLGHLYYSELPLNGPETVILNTLLKDFPYLDLKNPLKKAEEYFQSAVNIDPTDYWTNLWLGSAMDDRKRFSEAELVYANCQTIRSDIADAYFVRAILLAKMYAQLPIEERKPIIERALIVANNAVRIAPDHYYSYYARGDVLKAQGKFDEAMKEYDNVIKFHKYDNAHDTTFPYVYRDRAYILASQGNWQAAYNEMTKCIECFPADMAHQDDRIAGFYSFRAFYSNEMGHYEDAHGDFAKCHKLRKNAVDFVRQADTYYRQGNIRAGIDAASTAIRIDPNRNDCRILRAEGLAREGKWDEAIDDLRKVVDKSKMREGSFGLAVAYLTTGRIEEYAGLCSALQRAIEAKDGIPFGTLIGKALLLRSCKSINTSQLRTFVVTAVNNQDIDRLVLRALWTYRKGEFLEATKLIQQYVDSESEPTFNHISATILQAMCQSHLGNKTKASELLTQAESKIEKRIAQLGTAKNKRDNFFAFKAVDQLLAEAKETTGRK